MRIVFDGLQEHQLEAVSSVVDLLKGQACHPPMLSTVIENGSTLIVVPNVLDLSNDTLLLNLTSVQQGGNLKVSDGLSFLGEGVWAYPNFSIEMETGTGKTYVYIRTALELSQRYGIRKYIIVVPSVAIREGVLKTFRITKEHFRKLYDQIPYRYFTYDSANLDKVRGFSLSEATEFMIMTVDAFRGASKVFNQSTDRMRSQRPVDLVAAIRPVVILDEPQNMETSLAQVSLASLHPLMALRYSATHRSEHNIVYRLTPFEAYQRGLVKQIEVASIVERDNVNSALVRLEDIVASLRIVKARLTVRKAGAGGSVREAVVTVKPGDKLEAKTGLTEYAGYEVDEISPTAGFIRFSNGVEVGLGVSVGTQRGAIVEAQVRTTIEQHFRKQERLRPLGIKVLSLFFIDHVDNYAPVDAPLRRMFVDIFNELKVKYPAWKDKQANNAQASYFATKQRKNGGALQVDTGGDTQLDEAAYKLIMQDKERLLSFDEEVAFIFSHSALREGWDNPNVFQVCTLREVGSETQRRQQVGRGVRLAVNQQGQRIFDRSANVLTVVASESYERFVEGLQADAASWRTGDAAPLPGNAAKRRWIKIRPQLLDSPEFQQLWHRVSRQTRYSVQVDTVRLIEDAGVEIADIEVPAARVVSQLVTVAAVSDGTFASIIQSSAKTVADLAGRFPLPDLLTIMASMLEGSSPPMRLTRRTLLSILTRADRWELAVRNPHAFASAAIAIIKEHLAKQLVGGIRYEPLNEWFEMSLLKDEFNELDDTLVESKRLDGSPGASLYDAVPCDSETVEKVFVKTLEERADVKVYVKLPRSFTVQTPIGLYNPDWAIVVGNDDPAKEPVLYLVRETKGNIANMRPSEKMKTDCGKRHFRDALHVDYKVIEDVEVLS